MASIATSSKEGQKSGRARPQSVMALQFSSALDDIFGLQEPTERDLALEEKRKSLHVRSVELAELQARLKAMEAKLGKTSSSDSESDSSEDESTTANTPSTSNEAAVNTRSLVVGKGRPAQKKAILSSESEETSEEEEEEEEEEEDSETDETTSEEEESEEEQPRTKSRRS